MLTIDKPDFATIRSVVGPVLLDMAVCRLCHGLFYGAADILTFLYPITVQ
jgi:hypothetical protein